MAKSADLNKERQSNIELLRIITMFGVIILHYNNADIGGAFKYVEKFSPNFFLLYFFESIFICAVNLFILISGYFMCTSKVKKVAKPITLLLQVIIYKFCLQLVSMVISSGNIDIKSLLTALIPDNYFVILYIALYFTSPYINLAVQQLTKKQFQVMLIVLLLVYSVWNISVDAGCNAFGTTINGLSTVGMYGSQRGYSIVNFILMYLIGAYIRLHVNADDFGKKENSKLLIGLTACICIIMAWSLVDNSAFEYCNPFVCIEAAIFFMIFLKMKIIKNKVINKLAKGAFSVFLLQNVFLARVHTDQFVNKNIFLLFLHIAVSTIGIYICCWIVDCIYGFITSPLIKLLNKRLDKVRISVE